MTEKGYYYNLAKELIENEIDLELEIIDRTFTDLDHVAEFLIDSIDVIFENIDDDGENEREMDKHRIEIYDYLLKECKEQITHALRVRTLFETLTDDKTIMKNYNNNHWDLLDELTDATPDELATLEKFFYTPDELAGYKKLYNY